MIDFNKLLEAPPWVILAGIAIYFVLESKKDRDYYRAESKEDKKNFLEALESLGNRHENRMDCIEKEVCGIKEVVVKIDEKLNKE
ncbi:MAG: hypothetical protein ACRDAG_01185 [Cetobacterium somerae]|uniref:hypothetical protein n=2 Tax=Cetobacterium TaxID=180162 RepID=UPI003EE796D8